MVTLSRVTTYGNPRFPSMVTQDRVTIYGNPIYFPNKTGPGFIPQGWARITFIFLSFFPFRCVNGFYLGHELSFFSFFFFFTSGTVGPVVNYDPHRA
jgi:hypothetical protein